MQRSQAADANLSNLPVSGGASVPTNTPPSPFAFANPPVPQGNGARNDPTTHQQGVGPSNVIPGSPFIFANPQIPQGSAPENIPKSPFRSADPPLPQAADAPNDATAPQGAGGRTNIPGNPFAFQNFNQPRDQPLQPSTLSGTVTNPYHQFLPLSQAISSGDLDAAIAFLNERPGASTASLFPNGAQALHSACSGGQTAIVKELLRRMSPGNLLIDLGPMFHTPLTVIAINGNMEIAKALVEKNPKVLEMPGYMGDIPVVAAVCADQKDMARYLYSVTPKQVFLNFNGYHGILLLASSIFFQILDIALDLLEECPRLAVTKNVLRGAAPICITPSTPALFPSCSRLGLWKRFLYSCIEVKLPTHFEYSPSSTASPFERLLLCLSKLFGIDQVYQLKMTHLQARQLLVIMAKETSALSDLERSLNGVYEAFFFALKHGAAEFMVEMIKTNPDLLTVQQMDTRKNLFILAIEFRQEKIFSLLNGLDERRDVLLCEVDTFGNGMLHYAGVLSPPNKLGAIPGPALQMQRELQWFKEVESIVPDISKQRTNSTGSTPREVFSLTHGILQQQAERWMKDTSTSCSLVAALIVTVTFTAAFTVPGGTNEISGIPLRLTDKRFMVFTVSNIISFFASCTSVLIFLGILSARYSEDDFLVSLPTKMIAGLSILFISIAAMMVAFSSALFTLLHQTSWIVLPVILLACLPIMLFVLLQYPLLMEMIISTYGRGIFVRKMKPWL